VWLELPFRARIILHLYNKLKGMSDTTVGYHLYTAYELVKELLAIGYHLADIVVAGK
jgi:hypothetical protein